jgi:hypothetical protein
MADWPAAQLSDPVSCSVWLRRLTVELPPPEWAAQVDSLAVLKPASMGQAQEQASVPQPAAFLSLSHRAECDAALQGFEACSSWLSLSQERRS